jgi:hypothetical protein
VKFFCFQKVPTDIIYQNAQKGKFIYTKKKTYPKGFTSKRYHFILQSSDRKLKLIYLKPSQAKPGVNAFGTLKPKPKPAFWLNGLVLVQVELLPMPSLYCA